MAVLRRSQGGDACRRSVFARRCASVCTHSPGNVFDTCKSHRITVSSTASVAAISCTRTARLPPTERRLTQCSTLRPPSAQSRHPATNALTRVPQPVRTRAAALLRPLSMSPRQHTRCARQPWERGSADDAEALEPSPSSAPSSTVPAQGIHVCLWPRARLRCRVRPEAGSPVCRRVRR